MLAVRSNLQSGSILESTWLSAPGAGLLTLHAALLAVFVRYEKKNRKVSDRE
jgi:hypothetical protein